MISAVVPARNEEYTVASVVRELLKSALVREVIVVDSASSDLTADVAHAAGARVVRCTEPGLGRAMKAGIAAAKSDWVLRTDADITDWQHDWVRRLWSGAPRTLRRGIFRSPYDSFPVTNLVVRPFFQLYRPEWEYVPLPLSGTYLFAARDFNVLDLPDNWAIDIAILTSALSRSDFSVESIEIGTLTDAQRTIDHYVPMAKDINEYLTRLFQREIQRRLLC